MPSVPFPWLTPILGNPNERKVKRMMPVVDHVHDLEHEMAALSDEALQSKTQQFRLELSNRQRSEDPKRDRALEQEALELILPEAFAVTREAAKRVLNMRHFDMQIVGGMVLHHGGIAEMRTGEGKTLVATLPAYLNALMGKGVHVVTVNDYLAARDAEWMGQIYRFLGLSVGTVLSNKRGGNLYAQKKEAYASDITYGTNNEFGFDYLRDNMATSLSQLCQRPFYYAIIDEVDSILIDEARTPLIISGRLERSAETYLTMAQLVPQLADETDYTVDRKARNVILTEEGIDKAQELLGVPDLFDPKTNLAHYLLQALKAKELFKKDIDYVVKDDSVVIVDEFTGRLMEGRRWSDGQHQAIEAKEGVAIQDETQTLASITFQNLFRLYPKLSGMTGTAMTEEAEFGKIYNLEVTTIPTNRSDVRTDHADVIYKTEKVKYFKVVEEIVDCHQQGRPVLVGTTSIEKSEYLSHLLTYPVEMTQHLRDKAARLSDILKKDAPELLKAHESLLSAPDRHTADVFDAAVQVVEASNKSEWSEVFKDLGKTAQAVAAIKKGLPHQVLNAKQHEREAHIVAQAGRLGAITIATNMAGRGTDILLGGNPEFLAKEAFTADGLNWREVAPDLFEEMLSKKRAVTDAEKQQVVEAGGLHIIGTERHESRRIDNQLRGRAARQGDPGSTRFYLSLEDNLMKLFGGQKIAGLMELLNVDETLPITAKMVSSAIEGAQRKVEAYHFDIRKNILKYDDVLTEQRRLIYEQRRKVLYGEGLRESVQFMIEQEMGRIVSAHLTENIKPDEIEPETLEEMVLQLHAKVPQLSYITAEGLKNLSYAALIEKLQAEGRAVYQQMEAELTAVTAQLQQDHGVLLQGLEPLESDTTLSLEQQAERAHPLRLIEREILLSVVDSKWIDYLHNLDALREGIGLRAYGQKNPLIEYKREAFEMFQALTYDIQREATDLLFRAKVEVQLERSLNLPPEALDALQQDSQPNVQQSLPEVSASDREK